MHLDKFLKELPEISGLLTQLDSIELGRAFRDLTVDPKTGRNLIGLFSLGLDARSNTHAVTRHDWPATWDWDFATELSALTRGLKSTKNLLLERLHEQRSVQQTEPPLTEEQLHTVLRRIGLLHLDNVTSDLCDRFTKPDVDTESKQALFDLGLNRWSELHRDEQFPLLRLAVGLLDDEAYQKRTDWALSHPGTHPAVIEDIEERRTPEAPDIEDEED